MSESERIDQLSGGGEDEDDVAVSSLRRRRRLSSAALGSPSSSSTSPSSIPSCLSVSEAAEVESAGCEEETAAPFTCSELGESFSWLGLSVLLPAAGDEAVWLVPLPSARGGVSVATVLR